MPELTIIVPVYKVEPYLRRCIDSILNQTFRDFELILIDDGSPDNCGAICDEYAEKDGRITVIHQKNQGVSAARNAGLDIARGTYLGFVDSDDWIEPEMYETMITTAKEKNVDVVVCGFSIFDEFGEHSGISNREEGYLSQQQLHEDIYQVPNPLDGVCWNKLLLGERVKNLRYPVDIPRYEDTIFLMNCFMLCTSGYKLSETMYNVVERHGSATRSDDVILENAAILGSFQLYLMHKKSRFSDLLHPLAVNKLLYDCCRYGLNMKSKLKQTNQRGLIMRIKVKWLMLRVIVRAYIYKLLPKAKIHGYIMGMIKL